jgi:rhodanese-related sulfurtransferase
VPRIGPADAWARVEASEAILVDVRPAGDYRSAHIARALSMPASEVARRYTELPSDKLIIFYCA